MFLGTLVESAHTILVVEDDPDVRRALTELLASEGYEVAATADGGEALQTLRGGLRPAVILLDLMMPNCDGWDFRREQLEDPAFATVPVVLVTAAGFSPDSMRSQLGPIELCPKPIQPAVLLATLARLARVKGAPTAYS
ncbi:MAG TPA: response regulator [Polyangia bacterium]|jgi:CheY-like chemotaxis protein|nr:response regulator [Polyangia bacterium]